ncbi:MAG TPA: DUF2807 domain-containing protein [Myxococcales bacterium]|jgi:hypothetical protein
MDRQLANLNLGAALLVLSLSACGGIIGSGTEASESREITAFSKISLNAGIELQVQAGQVPSLVVSGDDNVLSVITTAVDGDELKIGVEPNTTIIKQKPLVVRVTTASLTALELGGGAKANVSGVLESDFTMMVGGASEATVIGKATNLTAEAAGGSTLHLGEFMVQDAHLIASSSSQIEARVYGTAKADASSGSTITIRGGATVDKTETGGASVTAN